MDDAGRRSGGEMGSYAGKDRSAGEIVKDIVANAHEIIRAELRLAKAEVREEGRKAIHGGTVLAAGAVTGLYGIGFVLAAITAALALVMPWWAAALIVGGVLVIAGAIALQLGLKRWKQAHTPEKAVTEMKENVEWLKRQTKS